MNATKDLRTVTLDGLRMHCTLMGEGPPLVLLHGFTGTGADWVHVFDLEVLARRYRLIIPDLRGHGRTDNPSEDFTTRQCGVDVLALLDSLGIERFRAIGMSLGGNTLLHLATRAPGRLERMVLVSSTPYYPAQARRIMATFTEESRTEAEWADMRSKHVHGDAQIRALWRHGRGFADSFDDMNFTPPLLGTVRARTLLVQGDQDPLYPLELSVELYRAIPASRLWVVPGGGHGPIFGEQHEDFARTALAFLEEPAPAS
ncbi:alpha/beta fold hydrolase [Myxococcus llanfairpwllgwyngyllgogerychwyrndrobwllllantysiliogogogochensis]|uniref:Alpha/beta fold hydrolase n=1 Tax=Myxococcus llanfairpwllgwyngyllgogerychwyrndrobwllllantysiliogogogochensis TaxID=2590453 RepID=A0A540X624_9BACT|nr:alpha/beta hydrolase [Myxococcus llanfairpwllgwyngyllgogerychwyrndrobwllllantysiliogogogochensis]TQF16672.1 alpha/beta fold hydrolase [Myxococcus llanfairpwllgwyngyllgogerychwyrndrobwllllantysiliogogogochensis]